jgi:hypothetical protein
MSLLHGSSIPGTLEGAPFHDDNFMLSFNSQANDNGTLVYVGAVVTIAEDADFTIEVTNATNADYVLGVAQTSGQLSSAIDVICRGVVTATVDENVTAGDLLVASEDHDGMLGNDTTGSPAASRVRALQSVDGSSTPAPCLVLIY